MKRFSSPRGFALVATLAILVVVTIFLVAFATTMRTERIASQNFVDRDRAEAVGMGMINRIMAEHAAPMGLNGQRVKSFTLEGGNYNSTTGLPDLATAQNYYAAKTTTTDGPNVPIPSAADRKTLEPIYRMVPQDDDAFHDNCLVRTSVSTGGGGGENAYNQKFWAYDGLTDLPAAQPKTTPQWVNYYQSDDPATKDSDESTYPVAQVAFAIWDEGGRFDVNVVGKDIRVNGIAPHNLQIEKAITTDDGKALENHLNNDNGNGKRDRSDFSLRSVVSQFYSPPTGSLPDDKGDDRWVFSMRELIQRHLIDQNQFQLATIGSRDFDVRPEWDGDRSPKSLRTENSQLGAEDFLRSYINNPALFGLFYGAGGVGPSLVLNNLNNENLLSKLHAVGDGLSPKPDFTEGDVATADWMQVLRLLAVLRRALPDYSTVSPLGNNSTFDLAKWSVNDVFAIGQNIVQATDAASDHNLVAFDPVKQYPYLDQNSRVGARISPYITEAALKVKKLSTDYEVAVYIKIWNPYPFKLKYRNQNGTVSDILYRVGFHTRDAWPANNRSGLFSMDNKAGRAMNVTAPDPGTFKVFRFKTTISAANMAKAAPPNTNYYFRLRPFLTDMAYSGEPYKYGGTLETANQCLQLPGFFFNVNDSSTINAQLLADLRDYGTIQDNEARWYSFQIDDPRMGSIRRNVTTVPPSGYSNLNGGFPPPNNNSFKWSWILYNKHAMLGCPVWDVNSNSVATPLGANADADLNANYDCKTFNINGQPVSGYNKNFGVNWPGAAPGGGGVASNDQEAFAKMMGTFALPGRPFFNIGEIGTVFAMRPWVTLNFANKIIPTAAGTADPALGDPPKNNAALLRPAAILDYFTTVGTPESMDFDDPIDYRLRYMASGAAFVNGARPPAVDSSFVQDNLNGRYQDKTWLFEKIKDGTTPKNQEIEGNLRSIRGRINLNSASKEALTILLKAPYRMPASLGLKLCPALSGKVSAVRGTLSNDGESDTDYYVTIDEDDAEAMAKAVALPITDPKSIRPLRMLSDLSQLYESDKSESLMKRLYNKYPQSVVTAMIGRLAQFGTVRAQCYTIDMVVRTLNPEASKKGKTVTTGEARLQARVYFDTFSRKSFVESVQYR